MSEPRCRYNDTECFGYCCERPATIEPASLLRILAAIADRTEMLTHVGGTPNALCLAFECFQVTITGDFQIAVTPRPAAARPGPK